MVCALCGAKLADGFRFCPECGAAQRPASADGATAAMPATTAPVDRPENAPTIAVPAAGAAAAATTAAMPTTQTYPSTAAMPVTTAVAGTDPKAVFRPQPAVVRVQEPRYTPIELTPDPLPLIILGVVAAAAAIAAVLLELYTILTDTITLETSFQDAASDALGAAICAAVVVVAGAVVATGRRSIGGGLLGGSGIGIAVLALMPIGATDVVFRAFQDRQLGSGEFTHEIGFFVAIGAAVLGLILFLVSIGYASGEGSSSAALRVAGIVGLLGTLAATAGPLIPMNDATFGDNFTGDDGETLSLIIRIAGIGLVLLAGVVGFLNNSGWGMGIALGGVSTWFWLWLATTFDVGSDPVGPAFSNPGSTDGDPHVVTSIGIVTMVVCAVVGLIVAATWRPSIDAAGQRVVVAR